MKKLISILSLALFCQCLSAQDVILDPSCNKFFGAGSKIVCAENSGDSQFTVVVDSLGVLLEKTLDTNGSWLSTQILPSPVTAEFIIQDLKIVGPDTTITLSADIVQRFEKLHSVAQSNNGDYFIGASSTFESPGNATVDSIFVLKVSPAGTLLRAQFVEAIQYGASLFNTLAIADHGADFYYYKITSGGPATTNQFRIARVNEANDSLQLVDLFQGFGSLSVSKSPCGNNVFRVEVTGYYAVASLIFQNSTRLWHLDYDLAPPFPLLSWEANDIHLSNMPIPDPDQNRFHLTLATADTGKITIEQYQPIRPFTAPDTFFIKKFDAANALLWEKSILLSYLPTNLLELPNQQVALLGIENDMPVVSLTACDSTITHISDLLSNAADFHVFPIPADGPVTIKVVSTGTTAIGRIFNPLGHWEKSFTIHHGQAELDLSGLPNGVYFIQVKLPGMAAGMKKLVVAR